MLVTQVSTFPSPFQSVSPVRLDKASVGVVSRWTLSRTEFERFWAMVVMFTKMQHGGVLIVWLVTTNTWRRVGTLRCARSCITPPFSHSLQSQSLYFFIKRSSLHSFWQSQRREHKNLYILQFPDLKNDSWMIEFLSAQHENRILVPQKNINKNPTVV